MRCGPGVIGSGAPLLSSAQELLGKGRRHVVVPGEPAGEAAGTAGDGTEVDGVAGQLLCGHLRVDERVARDGTGLGPVDLAATAPKVDEGGADPVLADGDVDGVN